jgi:hypothetical protein
MKNEWASAPRVEAKTIANVSKMPELTSVSAHLSFPLIGSGAAVHRRTKMKAHITSANSSR